MAAVRGPSSWAVAMSCAKLRMGIVTPQLYTSQAALSTRDQVHNSSLGPSPDSVGFAFVQGRIITLAGATGKPRQFVVQ
jgi:hypothetical protein